MLDVRQDTKPEVDTTTIRATLVPVVIVPVTGHQQRPLFAAAGE